jgi:tRNA (guanosine-2'-O-)-methyltransferase
VGNEHRGVSEEMLSQADDVLKIPMAGFVQSLNVSVATAIVLWEITKQRMHSGSSAALGKKEQQALLKDFLERAKKQSAKKSYIREKP